MSKKGYDVEGHRRRREIRHQITREHGLPAHIPHGRSAYVNWGCRCDVCRVESNEETRAYKLAWQRRKRAERQTEKDEERGS